MKKLIFVIVIVVFFVFIVVCVEDVKLDNELSFNVVVVSDYCYCGLIQICFDLVLQVGVDYMYNLIGFYVGIWLINIKWIKDVGILIGIDIKGDVEWDIYGGKCGDIGGGFIYDVGGLYYYYLGNILVNSGVKNVNIFELYGQVGYGLVYFKYL